MFRAWWYPFSHYGVIHGDPHLGNYTVFEDGEGRAAGVNLLDYGCMRSFAPKFIQGVVDLYRGLLHNDRALVVHAYETWGFTGLSNELIDILNIWAKFIYGPMLEDRVRTIADNTNPAMYGRREAFRVHQGLQEKGPVKVPREFVFMDRAAIGLGGVFLHLDAELNYYRLFNDTIAGSDVAEVAGASGRSLHRSRRAAARRLGKGLRTVPPVVAGSARLLPGKRALWYGAGRATTKTSEGSANAYRSGRMPSGDGLSRAQEDLWPVPQGGDLSLDRRGRDPGVPLSVRGLTPTDVLPGLSRFMSSCEPAWTHASGADCG